MAQPLAYLAYSASNPSKKTPKRLVRLTTIWSIMTGFTQIAASGLYCCSDALDGGLPVTDFGTLVRSSALVKAQGSRCGFGCTYDDLPDVIAYTKKAFTDKPYCVVKNWTWIDIESECIQTQEASEVKNRSSVLFAREVIADEARRPQLGPMVRTSPLCEFQLGCLFVTHNTAYILCGSGSRSRITAGLMAGSQSGKIKI